MRIRMSKLVTVSLVIVGIAVLLIVIQFSSNGGICIPQGDIKTRIGGSWNTSGNLSNFLGAWIWFGKDGQGAVEDDEGFSYSWTADNRLEMLGGIYDVSGCGDTIILKNSKGGTEVLKRPKP